VQTTAQGPWSCLSRWGQVKFFKLSRSSLMTYYPDVEANISVDQKDLFESDASIQARKVKRSRRNLRKGSPLNLAAKLLSSSDIFTFSRQNYGNAPEGHPSIKEGVSCVEACVVGDAMGSFYLVNLTSMTLIHAFTSVHRGPV